MKQNVYYKYSKHKDILIFIIVSRKKNLALKLNRKCTIYYLNSKLLNRQDAK